jgi:hypothetical protein
MFLRHFFYLQKKSEILAHKKEHENDDAEAGHKKK